MDEATKETLKKIDGIELTEEMFENLQLYDRDGVLQTYETERDYQAALSRRLQEVAISAGETEDVVNSVKSTLTKINKRVADFADKNGLTGYENTIDMGAVDRAYEEYQERLHGDDGNTPEARVKGEIERFLITLSPSLPVKTDGPLIPKRGEIIHLHFHADLSDAVSSSNTDLKSVGAGEFYVTNKRFVFVFDSQVRSLPYREIEVFTCDWVPEPGTVRISSSTRARMMEFSVPNTLKVSFFFAYYTDPAFAERFRRAGNLHFNIENRRQLIDVCYARAEDGLRRRAEEAAREAAAAQATQVLVSTGPGCGVWVALLVVIAIIVIIVATNLGR